MSATKTNWLYLVLGNNVCEQQNYACKSIFCCSEIIQTNNCKQRGSYTGVFI